MTIKDPDVRDVMEALQRYGDGTQGLPLWRRRLRRWLWWLWHLGKPHELHELYYCGLMPGTPGWFERWRCERCGRGFVRPAPIDGRDHDEPRDGR